MICYYDRKNKRKVINAMFFNNASPPANTNVALGRYDHFYACDVNTWMFEGVGKASIRAVIPGELRELTTAYWKAERTQAATHITENVEGNPELSAARQLIEEIRSELIRMPFKPIGIILDSELGMLKEINARRRPLMNDFFLRDGFAIIYASDATGSTEFFANLLIRMCDTAATDFLRTYQKENALIRIQ